MICRHCHKARVSRPRRLCWNCYYEPAIRALYPSTSKYGRRGFSAGLMNGKPVLESTHAAPGSLEKILVLMRRAELGQELWHPHDATLAGPILCGQAG